MDSWRDLVRQQQRLVEAALPVPAQRERHRHDNVDVQGSPGEFVSEELAHQRRQIASRFELERQHRHARRTLIGERRPDTAQRRRETPAAMAHSTRAP